MFEEPRDASSLADGWRDSCHRRCEPGRETVCIVKSDTSRDASVRGGEWMAPLWTGWQPLCPHPPRPARRYCRASFTLLEFVPPRLSVAVTLRVRVPGLAVVFGVILAVHVVELVLVIVTLRLVRPGS